MKNNMDELLKTALTPMNVPEAGLNDQIRWKIKEREHMSNKNMHHKRISAAVLVAACVLTMGSVTAVAAYRYLSLAEVATELEDNLLKNAFLSEDAILVNETQESGGYRITLLGSVAGRDISQYLTVDERGATEDNKIYTVIAIERADGTPMPDTSSDEYGTESFFASHYIQGLEPGTYSIMSMGGGYHEFVRNGVQYRLLEMDNIEMFADRGIYVGVSSGAFYDTDAYVYNEGTGKISPNEGYEGVNALFVLPVDESKADPQAAEEYLAKLHASWNAPEEPMEKDATDLSVEEFMEMLTPENIDEYASPVEATRQSCTPDEDGLFSLSWQLESGAGGDAVLAVKDVFPDGETGMSEIFDYSYSEDGLADLRIQTYTLNEDGTITFVIYMPVLE